MSSEKTLLKLLRISLGNDESVTQPKNQLPLSVDWRKVIDLSFKQGVAAIAVDGLQRIYDEIPNQVRDDAEQVRNDDERHAELDSASPALEALDSPSLEDLKYEWFGSVMSCEQDYELHCTRAGELTRIFAEAGMRSCILKGVGNSQMYPEPGHRACGDIDIWVEGGRERVLEFLRSRYKVGKAVVHHADVQMLPDVAVEVHYMPAWLYNPVANRRLQRYFEAQASAQFDNITLLGFARPQDDFNLVYSAVHIYKHKFQEELTLKQLVDYYYILQASSAAERASAYGLLRSVGLGGFAAWLMGVLQEELCLSSDQMLCPPRSGSCHRPLGEALCLYPWKAWHWFARRRF